MQKLLQLGATLSRTAVSVKPSNFMNCFAQSRQWCLVEKSRYVFEVSSDRDFQRKVIDKSFPKGVLVLFHNPQCKTCQFFVPWLERKVNMRKGKVVLCKVNAIVAKALHRYDIASAPTVMGIKYGEMVWRLDSTLGVVDSRHLHEQVDELIKQLIESSPPTDYQSLRKRFRVWFGQKKKVHLLQNEIDPE